MAVVYAFVVDIPLALLHLHRKRSHGVFARNLCWRLLLSGLPLQTSLLGCGRCRSSSTCRVPILFHRVCMDWTGSSSAWMWMGRCPFTLSLDQQMRDSPGRMRNIPESPHMLLDPAHAPSYRCLPFCRLTVLCARRLDCPRLQPEATSNPSSSASLLPSPSLSANDADGCIGVYLQLHRVEINSLFSCHAFPSHCLFRSHACCVQLALPRLSSSLLQLRRRCCSKSDHTFPRFPFSGRITVTLDPNV